MTHSPTLQILESGILTRDQLQALASFGFMPFQLSSEHADFQMSVVFLPKNSSPAQYSDFSFNAILSFNFSHGNIQLKICTDTGNGLDDYYATLSVKGDEPSEFGLYTQVKRHAYADAIDDYMVFSDQFWLEHLHFSNQLSALAAYLDGIDLPPAYGSVLCSTPEMFNYLEQPDATPSAQDKLLFDAILQSIRLGITDHAPLSRFVCKELRVSPDLAQTQDLLKQISMGYRYIMNTHIKQANKDALTALLARGLAVGQSFLHTSKTVGSVRNDYIYKATVLGFDTETGQIHYNCTRFDDQPDFESAFGANNQMMLELMGCFDHDNYVRPRAPLGIEPGLFTSQVAPLAEGAAAWS